MIPARRKRSIGCRAFARWRIPWRLLVLIAFIEACESSISLLAESAATRLGLQVSDPAGRVAAVLLKPEGKGISNAVFAGPSRVAPAGLVLLLVRWLLFRVEFGAGLAWGYVAWQGVPFVGD